MAEIVRNFWLGMPLGLYVILLLAIGIGIAGFIVPPMGALSPSLLKFIAMILGATWAFYTSAHIPEILEAGGKVSAQMGSASITIGRHRKEHLPEKEEIIEEETEENDTEEFNQ